MSKTKTIDGVAGETNPAPPEETSTALTPMPEPDIILRTSEDEDSNFHGAGLFVATAEERRILSRPPENSELDIRPDGLVYLPGVYYRLRLIEAFGPGSWALVPRGEWYNDDDKQVYVRGDLVVRGRFVSRAVGGAEYHPDNARQTYADALESAKTNCLMRCCKDLGIAARLWVPGYADAWKAAHAVEVWCRYAGTAAQRGSRPEKKPLWRLRNAPPIDMWPYKEDVSPGAGYPTNSAKSEAVQERPRKGPINDFSPEGSQVPNPGPKVSPGGKEAAKKATPSRPWAPELLAEALRMRAGKLDSEFKAMSFADSEARESAYENALSLAEDAIGRLTPDIHGAEFDLLMTAAMQYVFGVSCVIEEGLTYGQATALAQWVHGGKAGATDIDYIDHNAAAEFAKLKVHLATSGALSPGNINA